MAKKKTKKKKSTGPKRRRVGAVGGNGVIPTTLGVLAGGIGAPLALGLVSKIIPASVNANIVKWGGIAVSGVGGYMLATKSKDPLFKGIGMGLMTAAGTGVVRTLMPSLIGAAPIMMPTLPARQGMVAGPRDVPRIGSTLNTSGFPRTSTVAGMSNKTRIYGGA